MHQILKVADFSCLPPIFHIEKMEQQNGLNKNKSNFQQRKKIPLHKFHVKGDGLSPSFFPFFILGVGGTYLLLKDLAISLKRRPPSLASCLDAADIVVSNLTKTTVWNIPFHKFSLVN